MKDGPGMSYQCFLSGPVLKRWHNEDRLVPIRTLGLKICFGNEYNRVPSSLHATPTTALLRDVLLHVFPLFQTPRMIVLWTVNRIAATIRPGCSRGPPGPRALPLRRYLFRPNDSSAGNRMAYRRVEATFTISLRESNGHKILDTDHGEASQELGTT